MSDSPELELVVNNVIEVREPKFGSTARRICALSEPCL